MRRKTYTVHVGDTTIGSSAPVRIQSMCTTPTLDTDASVAQTLALAEAGAELVRLTAQGVAHAANLENIRKAVRDAGCRVPLVADIHFNANAAFEAARHVEKVRINPGNFADPGRKFDKRQWSDKEYSDALEALEAKFLPFIELCRANGTAVRIGVNHGSLSDRVMNRYGAGTEGMVESALEYLRICRKAGFDNVVVSLKASDVRLMTRTVRALAAAMDAENLNYPLHLGVTEAGNADEGRVKSAIGIGSLLIDGIGDTIRVSLSEDPCAELPVARRIVEITGKIDIPDSLRPDFQAVLKIDTPELTAEAPADALTLRRPEDIVAALRQEGTVSILWAPETEEAPDMAKVDAAVALGYLLLAGKVRSLTIAIPGFSKQENTRLAQIIVQAAGLARFRAETVACPGCGRTLFDLPSALEEVKKACSHLRHLKIAVMGCIVNGPGEMADADFGYVGAGAGKVSIYKGIEPVIRGVDQDKAIDALISVIKEAGQWVEP